jgi:hypothetical protein
MGVYEFDKYQKRVKAIKKFLKFHDEIEILNWSLRYLYQPAHVLQSDEADYVRGPDIKLDAD